MELRVGIGHDTHRLGADRPLRLGGVEIPFDTGLCGHSDADVLLHAVTDAVLGALGKGDIGEWFPDTEAAHRDADSRALLRRVVAAAGPVRIRNLDCTVFAEAPKLGPYKASIRAALAELLAIPPDRVNIKAKTGEQVGSIGRGEAIGASAVVLIELDPVPACKEDRSE